MGLLGDLCSILSSANDVLSDLGGGSLFSQRLLPVCNISMMLLPRIRPVLQYHYSIQGEITAIPVLPVNDPVTQRGLFTPLTLCRNSSFSPLFTSLYV